MTNFIEMFGAIAEAEEIRLVCNAKVGGSYGVVDYWREPGGGDYHLAYGYGEASPVASLFREANAASLALNRGGNILLKKEGVLAILTPGGEVVYQETLVE